MDDFDKIKEIVQQEIMAVRTALKEHPERYSAYGKAYWEGDWSALRWVVLKMEEVRPLESTTKGGDE